MKMKDKIEKTKSTVCEFDIDVLKTTITSALILVFPDTTILFCIKADSLDYVTEVVLF